MSKKKKSNKTVLFLTPVSVFAVCAALGLREQGMYRLQRL